MFCRSTLKHFKVLLCRVFGALINPPVASCLYTILVCTLSTRLHRKWKGPWSASVHADLSEIIWTLSFIWAALWEKFHVIDILVKAGQTGSTYWDQIKCFDGTCVETSCRQSQYLHDKHISPYISSLRYGAGGLRWTKLIISGRSQSLSSN